MREILFRGKRTGNGEWIYGLPYECDDTIDCIRVKEPIENIIAYISYKVIPETVGQYTGLTANGTKIFEGDIVKVDNIVYVCRWNSSNYEFELDNGSENFGIAFAQNIEVIGNIHDNPELMEEGAE